MAASSSVSTAPMPTSATMAHASSDSASSTASSASSSHTYSYSSSGQDARATAFRGLGVTRYLVKTSDVLEDFRITIALESSPSTVIWHTERYLTPDQIILHLIHTPTREVLWTVLRPISTRRQGWYIRLRSPQFPEGMHIPLKPIPRTSPYYVEEGCLSFRCRTNAIPLTPAPNLVAPALGHGYSDSASSTGSSVHSYPPTPPPMSPIATPNSLRSASIDLLANSHSTVATTPKIGVPKSRDIVPPSLLISEATEGPAIPPESSSAQLISPLESTTDLLSSVSLTALPGAKPSLCRLQTPSSVAGGKRRAVAPPPPLQLPSEITEFILAPMEASAALYPAQQLPGANPLHPITHTEPSTTGNNGAVSALSSIFNKALSLLKSQTSSATTGTSFTLTRIPPAPKFSHDSYGSAPPPYNGSTQTLSSTLSPTSTLKRPESPTTPTAASYSSQTHPPAHYPSQYQPQPPHLNRTQTQTSFSSASLLATPLPQPLLTFTDTTPYLTVYSSSGILEIREDELRTVGVEKAFWICVAVVYWGYMGDREGWVWAGEE